MTFRLNRRAAHATALAAAAVLAAWGVAHAAPPSPGAGLKVTGRIAGPDGGWDYAAFDPTAQRLYVAHGDGVMAIDAKTGAVTAKLIDGHRVHAALPIPGSNLVVETNGETDTTVLFDGLTGKVAATLPVGAKPDAAAYDPASHMVAVMNGKSGDVSFIDPVAMKVVGAAMVGGALEAAAADGSGRLFVNVEDKNEVAVIDVGARKVTARYPLKGCDGPTGLAVVASSHLMISACANGVAKVLSTRDGHEIASLAIGLRPDGAMYDAPRGVVLIPSGGDGTLAVIDVRDAKAVRVVETVATAPGARTGAVDESTGHVYLPTARFAPAARPGGRPQAVPGSFAILVLSR